MKDKARRYEAIYHHQIFTYYSSSRNHSRDNWHDLFLSLMEDYGIIRATEILNGIDGTYLSIRDD